MNKTEVSQPTNMQSAAEMGTEKYHNISWVSNRLIGRFSSSASYRRPAKISAKAAITYKFKNTEYQEQLAMESMEQLIEQAADLVSTSERIIVFTGAGVSTESGIPDFRGPDGIWSKYDEEDFAIDRFLSDSQVRKLLWDLLAGGELTMTQAKPNPGHYAIAELEKMGKLHGVVTQNVDGLHQKAGVSENMVFQLHGDLSHARCLSCNTCYPMEEIVEWMKEDIDEPECGQCKGMLRPDAVLVGEQLPFEVLTESESRSRSCDLCIVLGSTLTVYPAAHIPRYAQQGGAKLVIINIGPTEMDRMADIRIEAKTGEATPKIIARAKEKM